MSKTVYTADINSDDSSEDFHSWIDWYCKLKGNEIFCQIDESYIQDSFNLTGLSSQVAYYNYALETILDIESNETFSPEIQDKIEEISEVLYGLIHARFILTAKGLDYMCEKFKAGHFGFCPRVLCAGQPVLPVGVTDSHNLECVRMYCPRCEEVYVSRSERHKHIDGAYFGTTFPHLFFLTYPDLKPSVQPNTYEPRVFGFKIHKSAYDVSRAKQRQIFSKKKRF